VRESLSCSHARQQDAGPSRSRSLSINQSINQSATLQSITHSRPTPPTIGHAGFVRRSLGRYLIGISRTEWDRPADRGTENPALTGRDGTGRPAHSNVQLESTSGNNASPSTFIVGVNIRPDGHQRRPSYLARRPDWAAVARPLQARADQAGRQATRSPVRRARCVIY